MQLFYTIKTGDTLLRLSKIWGIPEEALISSSNIKSPDRLYAGQQISVPSGINISGVYYYTVQPGDTLFLISRRYNVVTNSLILSEVIIEANNLSDGIVLPGMKLKIPYVPPAGGGRIAYISDNDKKMNIFLYNPQTGESYPIPFNEGIANENSELYWSPNAASIALIGKSNILYITHLTGGQQMIDTLPYNTFLSWAPDSQSIVYSKDGNIIIYNIFTYRAFEIKVNALYPQWYPDGKHILYTSYDSEGISQIYKISDNGTEKQQLSKNKFDNIHNLQISPNGLFALYTTPGESISLIKIMELKSGKIFELPSGGQGKNYNAVWSPDSSQIAYSSTEFINPNYYSVIKLDDPKNRKIQDVSSSSCFSTKLSWNPEGNKIAYLSRCGEGTSGSAMEMWVVDKRDPYPVRILENMNIYNFAWSPQR
jgi:TolB protein